MENIQKYSLALVGEDGTTVLASLSCSPKYKSLNLETSNGIQYTLKELCYFTFCFSNHLALRNHLAHTKGCIVQHFKDNSSLVYFAMIESKLVILDEFGNIVSDTLLFSDDDFKNEFDLENPLLFFKNLIISKFKVEDIDVDWLLGFSECMREVLVRQKECNSSLILDKRLRLVDTFAKEINFFKKEEDNILPHVTVDLDYEALSLLLERIFSIIDLEDANVKISSDSIDWELILSSLKYYKMKLLAKKDSLEESADTWREKYNKPRRPSRGGRGNKGWA